LEGGLNKGRAVGVDSAPGAGVNVGRPEQAAQNDRVIRMTRIRRQHISKSLYQSKLDAMPN
jgi:hypothetical protein